MLPEGVSFPNALVVSWGVFSLWFAMLKVKGVLPSEGGIWQESWVVPVSIGVLLPQMFTAVFSRSWMVWGSLIAASAVLQRYRNSEPQKIKRSHLVAEWLGRGLQKTLPEVNVFILFGETAEETRAKVSFGKLSSNLSLWEMFVLTRSVRAHGEDPKDIGCPPFEGWKAPVASQVLRAVGGWGYESYKKLDHHPVVAAIMAAAKQKDSEESKN